MTTASSIAEIGRVLRASTEGFTCGTRSTQIEYPAFGAFVQTTHINGSNEDLTVVGLITAIRIDDDPLVRQMIMSGMAKPAALLDQRENRLIPVEVDVINVGYVSKGRPVYSMPPRPPMSLDSVCLCPPEYVEFFTEGLDFLRLILNSGQNGSTTDLLGASIKYAAMARLPEDRRPFLINAGRRLAGLLSHDLTMLQQVINMIRPA